MAFTRYEHGHSIVLLGDFNPKLFQPAWFSSEGLLQKSETDEATIELIHSQVAAFSMKWLRVEVTNNRFFVATKQEPYDQVLRDLAAGTFRILSHTPINGLGINREFHYKCGSTDECNRAGDLLAPKEIWSDVLNKPGLLNMTMGELHEKPSYMINGIKGHINVSIESSPLIENGIYFNVNDHFELKEAGLGSKEIIHVLENNWEESYKHSEKIVLRLLEKFK